MSEIRAYLQRAVDDNCSELLIAAGKEISLQKGGTLLPLEEEKLTPEDSDRLVRDLYRIAARRYANFTDKKDDSFSFSLPGLARFRVCAYVQRGSRAAAVRVVKFGIPDWRQMNIPASVMSLAETAHGLVLVTGPGGSGKSTTLACLVDAINAARSVHISTIEDPIEYLHQNKKGLVSQRELDTDTECAMDALRACLRQSPRVIVAGALWDLEVTQAALSAAEAGRLVISTLYTAGASAALTRIIDSFPQEQQPQVRVQLAQVLQAVAAQQLLPAADGGLVPAFEVIRLNDTVRNMILENRMKQIDVALQSFSVEGMIGMDESLLQLYQSGRITKETALHAAVDADRLRKKMRLCAE